MAAPYTYIKRKAEDALAAVVNSLKGTGLDGVTFFKGLSFGTLSTPRLEILAPKASPERFGETYTGNWTVTLICAVVSHKNDGERDQHGLFCGTFEDIVMRDDMETQMNAAGITDFTAFDPGWYPGDSDDSVEGSEVRTEYEMSIYCKPS